MNTTIDKGADLAMPEGLDELGRRAHAVIVAYLQEHGFSDNNGCKAFYSAAEWRDREESYGTTSHLIVVYDGGALRPVFSMDAAYDFDCGSGKSREPYALYDGMQRKLHEARLYFEECTGCYSAVYARTP